MTLRHMVLLLTSTAGMYPKVGSAELSGIMLHRMCAALKICMGSGFAWGLPDRALWDCVLQSSMYTYVHVECKPNHSAKLTKEKLAP